MAARNIVISFQGKRIDVVGQATWTGRELTTHALKELKTIPSGSYVSIQRVRNRQEQRISKKSSNFIHEGDTFNIIVQINPTKTALRKWVYTTAGEVFPYLTTMTVMCVLSLYMVAILVGWYKFNGCFKSKVQFLPIYDQTFHANRNVHLVLGGKKVPQSFAVLFAFLSPKQDSLGNWAQDLFSCLALGLLFALTEKEDYIQELPSFILFLSTFTCSQLASCWSYRDMKQSVGSNEMPDEEGDVDEYEHVVFLIFFSCLITAFVNGSPTERAETFTEGPSPQKRMKPSTGEEQEKMKSLKELGITGSFFDNYFNYDTKKCEICRVPAEIDARPAMSFVIFNATT
uniref:Uncharacterized protein n=1 Tax=Ditylenchus dipsaci TaxID=166011 RepID=A0A915DGY3_9BILA